jgi:hypothetical protein
MVHIVCEGSSSLIISAEVATTFSHILRKTFRIFSTASRPSWIIISSNQGSRHVFFFFFLDLNSKSVLSSHFILGKCILLIISIFLSISQTKRKHCIFHFCCQKISLLSASYKNQKAARGHG